jgi:hypothetical protein
MPSSAKTLRRWCGPCASEEQPGTDLGLEAHGCATTRSGPPGRSAPDSPRWRAGGGLAGGAQLVPGAPGESLGADAAEHVVSRAQLLTGFTAKALPAHQCPVQQVAAGQVHRDTAPGQALDGFAVAVSAAWPWLSSARSGPRSPQPTRSRWRAFAGRAARTRQPRYRVASSDAGLDKLDQRPAEQAQIVMFACPLGDGERAVVAAKTVVQHRRY